MSQPNLKSKTYVVPANGTVKVDQPGTFIMRQDSGTGGVITLRWGNGASNRFDAGDGYVLNKTDRFQEFFLDNGSGANVSVTLAVGDGEVRVAGNVAIIGTAAVAQTKGATIQDTADVTLTNGAETQLLAAFATRRTAYIVADPANTVNIRIGKTGTIGAARGAILQPGQTITLDNYTGSIYGYAGAASQKVSLLEIGD